MKQFMQQPSAIGPVAWIGIVAAIAVGGCGPAEKPAPTADKPTADTLTAETPTAETPTAETLTELRQTLAATTDDQMRVLTIDTIATFGQKAKVALEELQAATAAADPRSRWRAARAIGLIGEDAILAVPVLVNMLADTDPIVATQAAAAIGLIRSDDGRTEASLQKTKADATIYKTAVDALIKEMTHPDARVRRASLRALRFFQLPPSVLVPLVNKQLSYADPSAVLPALHTLADMGAEAVPFLMESLKNKNSRYWATVALTEIGPAAEPAVALLAEAVDAGEPEERQQALLALAAIGQTAAAATPQIVAILESDDENLRLAAAFALGRMRAKAADKALEKAAESSEPFLASIAGWARASMDPNNKPLLEKAVAALRQNLKSDQSNVRSGSVFALSDLTDELGAGASAALADDFISLLADPDTGVRTSAAAALVRLGSVAVAALQATLNDPAMRVQGMEILTAIGPAARPATDAIIQALSDSDPLFQGDAAMAIAAIGPQAGAAVPALQKILASSGGDPGPRYSCVYALGSIGAAADSAVEKLIELTRSDDKMLATVAVWAALKIRPADRSLVETAVPLLRQALRGEQELVRLEAAVALGDIGSAARTAIPILELIAEEDPVKSVRAAATEALAKVRTP